LFHLPPLPAAPVLLLRALFKRKVRCGPGEASPDVPATAFACAAPGPAALARYNAALGFAPGSLPVSAHYLLAQRAHLATMLSPRFPFRLLGMVHAENRIVEHAAVAPGTPLRLVTSVRVAAPTRSGARFCVLDTVAWDGDRRVFDCASKYLAVAGRKEGLARQQPAAPALPAFGGWRLSNRDGRRYARVSGDWNPIHLARPLARLFGLRAPIIHGMHSVATALALLEADGERVTAVDVRFCAPAPLGSTVQMLHAPGAGAFTLVCRGRVAVEGSASFAPVRDIADRKVAPNPATMVS